MFQRSILSVLAGIALIWVDPGIAAELTVLTAGAFKPVVSALVPTFEAQTGHTVRVEKDRKSVV